MEAVASVAIPGASEETALSTYSENNFWKRCLFAGVSSVQQRNFPFLRLQMKEMNELYGIRERCNDLSFNDANR